MIGEPIYFVIYDEFTSEAYIPNGINMSTKEYTRHRFRLSSEANVKFVHNSMLEQSVRLIPIHIFTFIHNPEFFIKNGTVIYTIALSASINLYPEFFNHGMNNFRYHIDKKVRNYISGHSTSSLPVKLIISCLNEKCTRTEANKVLRILYNEATSIWENTEIWTPYAEPFTAEADTDRIKDVPLYESIITNEFVNYVPSNKQKRKKKFVSLCRRYQPERIAAFMFIKANNLDKDGYVSMPSHSVCAPHDDLYSLALSMQQGTGSTHKIMSLPFVKKVLDTPVTDHSYILDTEPNLESERTIYGETDQGYGFDTNQNSLTKFYDESYLSLIQEADMYQERNSYMITEKTIRPIMCQHMFVMIGPPHLLASLRKKGYRTFGDLWDESYDEIEDDTTRLTKSLNIFKDIVEGDIESLYEQARSIIVHNRDHAFRRIEEFREMLC